MAQLIKPLILSPATKQPLRRYLTTILNLTPSPFSTGEITHSQFLTIKTPSILIHWKNVHVARSRGLRPADVPVSSENGYSDSESDAERKSRNEKKREAKRGVRWAMELAEFNDVQIKRILRVIELEQEVFDAVMLVKRLGRDVREGKRRQFSYIGRLLRDVEPELIDGLIRATKDGDQQKFLELSGSDKSEVGDADEEEEEPDDEDEDEVGVIKGFGDHNDITTRWFDGLVNKDAEITNEIYSLSTVDFDRQELRKLVRNFCSMQDRNVSSAENKGETDIKLLKAKKNLTRFLITLAKQLPSEENYIL